MPNETSQSVEFAFHREVISPLWFLPEHNLELSLLRVLQYRPNTVGRDCRLSSGKGTPIDRVNKCGAFSYQIPDLKNLNLHFYACWLWGAPKRQRRSKVVRRRQHRNHSEILALPGSAHKLSEGTAALGC